MSDLQEERELVEDPTEDEQLTIRIPNPKVYMARQSLWIGRRGKPRCDHCRLNNLKCDRVLPACNHCSWATGRECKYTPLPTPAHRGIPRCDRCRLKNLKCDRNLPVCNHCKEDKKTECNYTPKKRRKNTSDATQPSTKQDPDEAMDHLPPANFSEGPHFYGQNVASSSRIYGTPPSPFSDASDLPYMRSAQTGRFTAEVPPATRPAMPPLSTIAHKRARSDNQHSLLPLSYPNQGRPKSTQLVPWNNAPFAPLPEFITRGLRSLNSAEIPDAAIFNESLTTFLDGVLPEIRETSCLTPDIYTTVYRSLTCGDTSKLSPRMREWASYHHLCSGSNMFHLILAPRESIYQAEEKMRETYRQMYCADVDGETGVGRERTPEPYPSEMKEDEHLFERLPVRDQIFDILSYTHISHDNAAAMLLRIRNLGFASITWPMAELYVRLCPTCSLRNRQESRPGHGEKA